MANEMLALLTKSQMSENDIQSIVKMIDQESANSIYRKCAEEFDFKMVEIERNVYSTAKELTSVFGYSRQDEVSRVLKSNQCETIDISGLHRNCVSLVRTALGLAAYDYRTQLIDYHGFLTVALKGRGSACDKVREYLLAMEQKARTDSVIYETTGLNTSDLLEIGEYANDPLIISSLEGQKRTKEIIQLRIQQLDAQKRIGVIETILEEKVSITPEQEHIILKRRDELIALQVQNGKDRRKAYALFTRNIKERFHFGIFVGLERSKFKAVLEWMDRLIEQEWVKANQMNLPFITLTVH